MTLALCNLNSIFYYPIYESVFFVYTATEPPLQIVLQSFRLADTLEDTVTLDTLYQIIYPFYSFPVLQLPVNILLPCTTGPLLTQLQLIRAPLHRQLPILLWILQDTSGSFHSKKDQQLLEMG